jgi:hypothetical protein
MAADSCVDDFTCCLDFVRGDCKSFAFNPSGVAICEGESRKNSIKTPLNPATTVWNPNFVNSEAVRKFCPNDTDRFNPEN